MVFAVAYSVGLLTVCAAGLRVRKRFSRWGKWERWGAVLVGPLLFNILLLMAFKIKAAFYYDHNWERLQNAFALALGAPLYHSLNHGPILNTLYGPVSVIAYLPATLASKPVPVMTIAASLTVVYAFLPVLWIHLAGVLSMRKKPAQIWVFTLLAFSAFATSAIFLSSSLRNAVFHVHADAPALGLGALACGFIALREKKGDVTSLPLSALCAVLSVWAKQVMAPLLPALALYILFIEGSRHFVRYLIYLFVFGAMISAAFIRYFGYDELMLNMIIIPSRQSLRHGWFFKAFFKLLRECLPAFVLAYFSIVPEIRKNLKYPFETLRRYRWPVFLFAAVFLIPTSLLGNGKIGGSNNTLSFTCYFLLLAATFAFAESARVKPAWKPVVLLSVVFLLIQVPSVYLRILKPGDETPYAQTVYEYILKNPGKGYFPRLNALNAMAEKKIYHASVALMDRKWADLPVKDEHLRAHLPEQMEFMAFREGQDDDKQFVDLPEYWFMTTIPELPGFRAYKRTKD